MKRQLGKIFVAGRLHFGSDVRVNLHHGKINEASLIAVIHDTNGIKYQVDFDSSTLVRGDVRYVIDLTVSPVLARDRGRSFQVV